MTRKFSVVISMPATESIYAMFVANLFAIYSGTKNATVHVQFAIGSVIHTLRNALAANAVQNAPGVTHVLFLDTDIMAPADVIDRLLSHDKDIVAGIYRQRKPPFKLIGEQENPDDDGELRKMKRVPAGCLLVKKEVFAKIGEPWFEFGFRGATEISEDYMFCEKARAAGYDIWCDAPLSMTLAHMALTGIHTSKEYAQ